VINRRHYRDAPRWCVQIALVRLQRPRPSLSAAIRTVVGDNSKEIEGSGTDAAKCERLRKAYEKQPEEYWLEQARDEQRKAAHRSSLILSANAEVGYRCGACGSVKAPIESGDVGHRVWICKECGSIRRWPG
jgi:hypothetical protein